MKEISYNIYIVKIYSYILYRLLIVAEMSNSVQW